MLKNRSKLINLLCSIVIGLILTVGTLVALFAGGVLGGSKPTVSFSTHSATALYDGTPLTNHGWDMISGGLDEGHEISVSFTGTQTNVGESDNVMTVTITDELGTDVTDDYKIKYTYGKLRVDPRSITVTSLGAEKNYDGEPLTYDRYTVTSTDKGLVTGHRAEVEIIGSIVDVGETFNTIGSVTIYDYNGKDVTMNYRITLRENMLKVKGDSEGGLPSFDGFSNLIPGEMNMNSILYSVYAEKNGSVYLKRQSFGDYNGRGFNTAPEYSELIDGQYSAAYLSSMALEAAGGSKSLLKIRAIAQSYALPYFMSVSDGKYDIQKTDAAFSGDASVEYSVYYLTYADGVTAKDGGSSLMSFEKRYRAFVHENYLSIDAETNEFMQGLIKAQGFDRNDPDIINKVADYISRAAKYDLGYDTALDSEKNVAIAFLSEYKIGVCRHYAMAATMMYRALGIPARYTVGVVGQLKGGEWNSIPASQAHAWIEVYIDGFGWVDVDATGSSGSGGGGAGGGSFGSSGGQSNVIEVTPVEVSKKYDGTPLVAENSVKGLEDLLKQGYTYKATVSGSRTDIGRSQSSTIEDLRVYDPSGKDVTDSFELVYKKGWIHVYSREVTFVSPSYKKVYDGKVDDVTGTLSSQSALYDGHTYEVKNKSKPDVGKQANDFSVVIYDETGKDVTDHYKINKNCGDVEIEHASITLIAGSATKTHDGTPLTNSEVTLNGSLAEGHKLGLCEVSGSQTDVGRSDNVITYVVILDANGNDVTMNYAITLQTGTLRVTR
ncbi:MAG: transglutaminase domain-containing protein [Clostridia bacterium]|nr:transglutaminase domain-containing protein [Clostridia bacterium]